MKRRIFSLLIALCLIVGLLPPVAVPHAHAAAAGDTLTTSFVAYVAGKKLTLTKYETPVYTVNTTSTAMDTDYNEFTITTQTTTGASEENWNTKLVWHVDDDFPTLYIKGLIVDEYNEATSLWKRGNKKTQKVDTDGDGVTDTTQDVLDDQGRVVYGNTTTEGITFSTTGQKAKLVIVEDSFLRCNWGVSYKSSLDIESEGAAKLTIWNILSCISNRNTKNLTLNINANLDLQTSAYSGSDTGVIVANNCDLFINGGDISVVPIGTSSRSGIVARTSGNLTFNGGNITVSATAPGCHAIWAEAGKVTVNGGTINASSVAKSAIVGQTGIEINGGNLTLNGNIGSANSYGLGVGTDAQIIINGGTAEINSYDAFSHEPVLGEGVSLVVGKDASSATDYVVGSTGYANYYAKFTTESSTPACEHANTTETEQVTAEASCTVPGSKTVTVTCDDCGETVSTETGVVIPATGHVNTTTTETETPASCGVAGSKTVTVTCDDCGETVSTTTDEITALEHSYTDYTYNKDATYNADGTETAYCDNGCGTSHTRTAEGTMLTGAVAEVGGVKYGTLAEALEKAEAGQTVTLLDDVTTESIVALNKAITLDLGGKSITRNDTRTNAATLYITAAATVKNGTVAINGNGIAVWVAADATIENVTVKGADVGIHATAGVATVTNSAVSASVESASESGDGIRAYNGATVVLAEGTTVYGSSTGSAVEVYAGAAVTVEAGAQIADNNIVYGGTLTVNGTAGAISTDNEMADGITDGYIAAANIVVGEGATVGQITLNTADATVTGAEGLDVVATLGDKVWYTGDKYVVHNHSYDGYISNNDATYNEDGTETATCVCGDTDTRTDEGSMLPGAAAEVGGVKYGTLAEALENAEAGQTVTLLNGVTTDSIVLINKEITLDLGGNSITRNDPRAAATTLHITAAATVKNGTVAATGNGIAVYVDANATIENVTVKGADVGLYANAAVTTVKNSTISASVESASESGDAIRAYNGATVVLAEGTTVYGSSTGSAVEVYAGAAVTVEAGAQIADNNIVYGGTLTVNGTAGAISTNDEMATGITDGYIAAANIVVGEGATVGQITLNTADATVTGAEGLDVVATLGDKVWYTEGKYVVHTHTEGELPAVDATCTESGKTAGVECSVCHDVLTAQEEIPATGHNWNEDGTCANGCDTTCPVISVVDNKVSVNANGTTVGQMHVFYLGDKVTNGEVNPENWSAVKAAAADIEGSPYDAKGYIVRTGDAMNNYKLPENGDYVLFVNYEGADGTESVSTAVTVDSITKPVISVEDGQFVVDMNGNGFVKAYIFYLSDTEGVDLTNWNSVKSNAAAQRSTSPYDTTTVNGFMTYNKEASLTKKLPEASGTYVMFVTYSDGEVSNLQVCEVLEK